MIIISIVQLVCLLIIVYFLLKLGKVLSNFSVKMDELVCTIKKLDRDSAIDNMTVGEAQKHYIRISSILHEWIKIFAREVANDVAKVFGDK